jgi:ribosome-binding protein aMBF1 (putative translation factor)
MSDDDLPLLPGFREMAQRHRAAGNGAAVGGAAVGGAGHDAQGSDVVTDLVARRHALGLSQGEVAARMGTSQPAVARFETGGVDARLSTLRRYAAAVDVRLDLELRTTTMEER